MHLLCQRDILLAAIQAADAIVPTNSTKPILSNLLIEALEDRVEIVATDTQVGLRAVVRRIEVRAPGQAVVNARQISAILKESQSSTVNIHLETGTDRHLMKVELSDGLYQVPALVGESLPPISPFPTSHETVRLMASRLDEMLNQTAFAMDKDRTSAVLSGLSLSYGNSEFILAATDGKVLCEAVERADIFNVKDRVNVVVPAGTVGHLQRIMSAARPDTVEITIAGKLAFLRLVTLTGLHIELSSRLVEGTFPSYRAALPSAGGSARVTFPTADLAAAVRRVALMVSQTSRGVVMQLEPGQATFTNLNYTNGSARIPVPCEYAGAPVKLGVDVKYLGDVLRVYRSDHIGIDLGRGLVMREPDATYLIMPISLPN